MQDDPGFEIVGVEYFGLTTSQPGSFAQPSFTVSVSGAAVTSGSDGTATVCDTGSVWVTVNGQQKSVSYGQGSTNTSVATALRDAINADSGYPVTAFLSGSTISVTAKTAGASTNYSLSGGSSTSQPGNFSQPSFTVATSGSTLAGGSDGGSTSAATAVYLHTDHLGSTRVCTDSNGVSTGTCDYEPFGEVQPGTTCSVPTNFRFAGMEWDANAGPNGLYHTWFRQYDPNQGRWMAVDPLVGDAFDPQSLDRFAYALNDPANFTDPLGLAVFEGGRLQTEFLYNGLSVGADFLVDTGILGFWDVINLTRWGFPFGEDSALSWLRFHSLLGLLQAPKPEKPKDPCAGIRAADLRYDKPRLYRESPERFISETAEEHIKRRHIDKAASAGRYLTDPPVSRDLTFKHVQILNSYTMAVGRRRIGKSAITFEAYLPPAPHPAKRNKIMASIGTDINGSHTLANRLVLEADCQTVITSYPIPMGAPMRP